MIIAVISLVISLVALIGVAAGLLLQARQVKVSQIQTVRAAHLELMKMALENSAIATEVGGISDPDRYSQGIFLNWRMKYFEMGYEVGYFADVAIEQMAVRLFANPIPRIWWAENRTIYKAEAVTRRTSRFFALVDSEFQRHEVAAASPSDSNPPG